MNRKIVKLSCLTLILMITISSVMFYSAVAQGRPKIYVDPPTINLTTDTTAVGATFNVSVKSADFAAPGVFAHELKVYYDKTMLEATVAAIPVGHWLTPASPANIFVVDPGTINTAQGFASFAVAMLGTEVAKTGGGTIATVTLKIIASPPPNGNLTSLIELKDVILVDGAANEWPSANYDRVPATFTYATPPLPKPVLSVTSLAWDNQAANAAGRLFTVTVSIKGLAADWHLTGIQFSLRFDQTLIATKREWILNGTFAQQFGDVFFVAFLEGDAIVGQLQLPPYPGPHGWMNGSGTIATIQFNATYVPPPKGECDLVLTNVLLVDAETNPVAYDHLENGHYLISVAPPPYLSVTPKADTPPDVTLVTLGDSFDLSILMNQLDKGWRMVGVEFKVRYNTTLLGTDIASITEGDFLKGFAQHVGTSTFFQPYLEEDHGLIGIMILPLPDGTWPFDVFPDTSAGPGLLAKIKFTAKFQAQQDDLVTNLQVYDALLADVEAKEIPTDTNKTATEGLCTCTILKAYIPPPIPPAERRVDLFTQYPDPYGGQGLANASDAFAPQGQVQLFAYVTYRGEPVPNKPVAYQIRGPNGYEFEAVNFTDMNGLSVLSFSIPASESYFGIWNITGSVDVAGQVVSDFVFFRVGWLISMKAMTITPNEGNYSTTGLQQLFKGRIYEFDGTLKVITMQPPNMCVQLQGVNPKVLLVYSGFDELGQPLFNQYMPLNVGYSDTPTAAARNSFVLSIAGRDFKADKISIMVPSSAFSGVATIRANVFTDFPWYSGVPYANPKLGEKQVWIKSFLPPQPTPPPVSTKTWLEVGSVTLAVTKTGTVDVVIHDVDPSAHITAIQFSVKFDTSLVNATLVKEGSFVKQFGDTFFTAYIENGLIVGELQLPPYPGANGWMTGTGTVATITFKALSGTGSCFLTLSDAFIVDNNANSINFLKLQSGIARVTP